MRNSKQSAVVNGNAAVTVVRSRPSRTAGCLCDCLGQPRRIRPLPCKSKDHEMVETRPGRLIRVVHLLPAKRNRRSGQLKQPANEIYGRRSFSNNHSTRLQSQLETANNATTSESTVNETVDSKIVINPIEENVTEEKSEEDEECDDNSLSDVNEKYRFSSKYGFENPFHPKNFLYTDDDDDFKVNAFADHLAATIVDDALLELGTLWRLILPGGADGNHRVSNDSTDRCYFLDGDFDDVNYRTWSSTCDNVSYNLNGSLNLGKNFSRNSVSSGREFREWENCNGVDNPSFEMAAFDTNCGDVDHEILSPAINGGNHFSSYRYPSASSPFPTRSSFSSCNGHSRQDSKRGITRTFSKTNQHENDVEPVFRIYRRPGGDDISSQPSTSFQSSIWGSSANSSMRYVRRLTSKRYKTKPLLYFIHGIGDSAELWKNQLSFFQEKGYETVAWDLIGHGLSSAPNKPKAYTFDVILTDALVTFDRYSRDRNVIVGHSYGCCFAAALARLRPKQVAHLIMISGGGPFPLYPHPQKKCLPACLIDCFRSLKSCGTRRFDSTRYFKKVCYTFFYL
ncbi:Protein abhd8, variant 3 [Chamberlinius hualienensis]